MGKASKLDLEKGEVSILFVHVEAVQLFLAAQLDAKEVAEAKASVFKPGSASIPKGWFCLPRCFKLVGNIFDIIVRASFHERRPNVQLLADEFFEFAVCVPDTVKIVVADSIDFEIEKGHEVVDADACSLSPFIFSE